MYNEAQRIATLKYRQKKKEKVNELERQRYLKMKETNIEKYKARVEACAKNATRRGKEKTEQNRHIRSIMRIELN